MSARRDVPLSLVLVCLLPLALAGLVLAFSLPEVAVVPLCAIVPALIAFARYRRPAAGRPGWLGLTGHALGGAILTAVLGVALGTVVFMMKSPDAEFEGMATGIALVGVTIPSALLGAICGVTGALVGARQRATPDG